MNQNINKIKKLSSTLRLLVRFLIVAIPSYYLIYWVFINQLPTTLISVNTEPKMILEYPLEVKFQIIGFLFALPVLLSLLYGLVNVDKLFIFYQKGVVFSYDQVRLFKNISKALIFWVVASTIYQSAKSVLFTLHNPPGERMITIGFGSAEVMILVVAALAILVAWTVEEGQHLSEEQKYTI
ncbi:DUF2975 domain-containing protein [Hydrogenovibrio kuenenii]|uniref:DUF2975 domain-containing protein n=1 Tax=Hydrogenovibrio kuenenii TaxID=63658 RepID=UPI000467A11B|nr:DUF2975 domain-containing protein [Hydrogenovibrio kuenenii]